MVVGLLIAVLLLAGVGALAVYLARFMRGELAALRRDNADELDRRNADVDRRLAEQNQTLDRRLDAAGKTSTQVYEKLGEVTKATAEMNARAKDLSRLEQALRPPKARGGFGEQLLENLLRDVLPPGAFQLQYTFPTGERVDAVIRAAGLMLPVDAKFPLDNFERMVAAEDDAERELQEKAFARDVRGHIDAIASKYIKPDHGTFDLAFMYLPSEAIHYELVAGKTGALLNYAHGKRVYPVSATTLAPYLQMIVLGLKGMQIEQRAEEVMKYCAALQTDFERFKTEFDLVGKHLTNAQGKFAAAEKRLTKFEISLDQAADEQAELTVAEPPAALPRALDAA
jgi:DNA recombination protein RmuC